MSLIEPNFKPSKSGYTNCAFPSPCTIDYDRPRSKVIIRAL